MNYHRLKTLPQLIHTTLDNHNLPQLTRLATTAGRRRRSLPYPYQMDDSKINTAILCQKGLLTWACIGDVLNPSKPAHNVATSIENQGRILYRVSPTIDPKDASSKRRLYKNFTDIPPNITIDAVNLCVHYRIGMIVLDEMKERGIQYCFMQPGADHVELIAKAEELGIIYQRGCMIVSPLMELDEDEKMLVEKRLKEIDSGCACYIL